MSTGNFETVASQLHGHFDRRSPMWFTFGEHAEDMRFVGLRKKKLAKVAVLIEAEPLSREASEARVGLVGELRRLGHRVSSGKAVPFALKRAFVTLMTEGDDDRQT